MDLNRTIGECKLFRPLVSRNKELLFTQKKKGWVSTSKYPLKNDTMFGVEVEVEQVHTERGISYVYGTGNQVAFTLWSNKSDGSLRNSGREFITVPIEGKHLEYAIDELIKTLTKSKTCIGHEFSPRTSVHVHINARNLTRQDIVNLLITYVAVEPVLYNYCGGRRHKNIFCVPVNQSNLQEEINFLTRETRTADYNLFIAICENWKKYCGINLNPITTFGTIEFRQMVGTGDKEKLMLWFNLIQRLKDYATSHSFEEICSSIMELNSTSAYVMFLREVFGEFTELLMFSTMEKRLEETIIFLKEVFVQNDAKLYQKMVMKDLSKSKDFSDRRFIQMSILKGIFTPAEKNPKVPQYRPEFVIVDVAEAVAEQLRDHPIEDDNALDFFAQREEAYQRQGDRHWRLARVQEEMEELERLELRAVPEAGN